MRESLLGLDIGEHFVGIAMASAGTSIALPIGTYERKAYKAERKILSLLKENEIRTLVVGLPIGENGKEGLQCAKVRAFCKRIEKRAAVKIVFYDEYGSSDDASLKLCHMRGGRKVAKSSGAMDAVSASIILQGYLESQDVG